jgi:transcriptional regulator with XRE-family HTH domain
MRVFKLKCEYHYSWKTLARQPVAFAAVLGEVLRKARQDAGLTQEQLAFRAAVARNYISVLESDEKSPTVKTLFRIAKALGVRASVLIARAERASKKH